MSLKESLSEIRKQFGNECVFVLGDNDKLQVESISSGLPSVDELLGVGGFPRGRVIEIFGPAGGGKTTLTLHLIAQAQKLGDKVCFIDVEHSLDPKYSARLGVDINSLLVSQPDYGEQALEIADALIRSGDIGVVVVDSVAALVPKAELEGNMGDAQMGLQARLMSQALRKLTASVSKSKTCLVFINQLRDKIGVAWGNPEVTTGGRALKFYASVRLDVRAIQTIKSGDVSIGCRTKIKCVKNKVAKPFLETEIDLIFGEGFSSEADLLDKAVEAGVVDKAGAGWYSFGGEKLGQGKENVRVFLQQNSETKDRIYKAVQKMDKEAQ